MADPADEGGRGQGNPVGEDSVGSQPVRSGVGTVPGSKASLEAGADACGEGTDQLSVEGAAGAVRGVWAGAARGRAALAPAPSGLAQPGRAGHVRQPGVVARQLPPADPRAG